MDLQEIARWCDGSDKHFYVALGTARRLMDEIERLRADLKAARDDREACLMFLRNELGWADFREEFFADNVSGENAKKLVAFLRRFELKAGGDDV